MSGASYGGLNSPAHHLDNKETWSPAGSWVRPTLPLEQKTHWFKLPGITLTRSLAVWGNPCYISLLAEVTLLQGETPTLLPATPTKCPSPQYVPELPLLFLLLLVPSRRKLTNWGEEGWLGNWGKQMGGQLAGQGSGGRGALVGSKSRIRSCGRLQIMATPLCGRMALDRPQNFADRPWIRQEKNLHLPHERGIFFLWW